MRYLTATVLALGCSVFACGPATPAPAEPDPASSDAKPDQPPEDPIAVRAFKQGEAALKAEDFEKAKALFTGVLDRRPDHARANYYLGVSLERLGEKAPAMERYRKALQLEPELSEAAINLSALLMENNEHAQAIPLLKAALAKSPSDPLLRTNLGIALASADDKAGALAQYRMALKLSNDPELRFNVSSLLIDLGENADALRELKLLSKTDGANAALLASVGRGLAKLGAFAECVSAFDKAIAMEKAAELYVHRGICRHELNDEPGAKDDYDKALALDSKYAPAHYYLGEHHLVAGNKREAIQSFQTAARLEPQSPLGKRAAKRAQDARSGKKSR